jgi:thiamine pyrophosphate-dependent acetolactate synthase large subunit-like protein
LSFFATDEAALKVFQSVADAIKEEGVEVAFALMGDANQNLIVDLAERCGVKIVNFRHEQNAVAAADGYARFSDGKLGVALVTMGPGLTNAATSLAAARAHRSPVLVLAGAASVGEMQNPQRFDQASFSHLLAGAGAVLESPKSLKLQLDQAFGHMRRGTGPFVLNLPGNIQNEEAPKGWKYQPGYAGYQATVPAGDALPKAAQILAQARCPGILAGRGALRARAAGVVSELASYLNAPVATTLPAKGLCSEYALWTGVSGGLGEGVALPIFAACDVLLVVGASLNQWTSHAGDLVRDKTVIQIDSDLEAFGRYAHADLILHGDARATGQALLDALRREAGTQREENTSLVTSIAKNWQLHRKAIDYETGEDGSIDPRQAVRELDRLLPSDRLVVVGGGHAGYLVCQLLKVRSPFDWNYTIDFGALGQSLGTAIGAAFARPNDRVYHLTTDGEFMMNLADFHTAVNYKLPMTVVILNDQGFGQERHDLEHKKLPIKYAMQHSPDFAKLAEGFGARGSRFDTPDSLAGLQSALQRAEDAEGPTVIDIRINGDYESPVSQEIAKALA